MSSTYKTFRDAAGIVRQGWLKGGFIDYEGNQCLVQSVMTSAGKRGVGLPSDFIKVIDEQLMKRTDYRALRALRAREVGVDSNYLSDDDIQAVIMAWNDVPWRRKGGVVKALSSIANNLAEQEIVRLTTEVFELKAEVAKLKEHIAELESENASLLRRLANRVIIKHEKSELEKLSEHLDAKWVEYSAVSEHVHQ